MYNIILFLIIFLSFLLVLVIMVQNPKGGGLASTFGGDSQQIGVQPENKSNQNNQINPEESEYDQ